MKEPGSTTLTRDEPLSPGGRPWAGRPLRVMFVQTSMAVGGAELLLVNLVRRIDRSRCLPELCCLKEPGPLGDELAAEIPVHARMLSGKYDLRVLQRLMKLLRQREIDAVITVGAGDKMFWGRLAARFARVPVVASALHSTGWPDGIGRLNRVLTPITDAFIAVAESHGRFLTESERLPAGKVCVIRNGVDTQRFAPLPDPHTVRRELDLGLSAPVVSIVAALRPEKDHELFLRVAARVRRKLNDAQFQIVGDGPLQASLRAMADELGLGHCVRFLGERRDVPAILTATDVLVLTSRNEANPVSILEAMSVGRPVVAPDVGSIRETLEHGRTGLIVTPGCETQFAHALCTLLENPIQRRQMGDMARQRIIERWSLEAMVTGYEDLVHRIYVAKTPTRANAAAARLQATPSDHSRSTSAMAIIDG